MELTSDIILELVDEPSGHVSKEGMVDVQWSSETSVGMTCRDMKHLNGMSQLHTNRPTVYARQVIIDDGKA